ncbi:hypothetical protein HYV89_04945 [Candidatus Woesearchaeota archaeon]|nr:hypothetical protein [Candidatus Woesearchaeota archaeon]
MPSFKYQEGKSLLFETIKRPLIELEIYSEKSGKWIAISDVLADTGADICLLPRFIGDLLVGKVTTGTYKEIRGIVPNTFLNGYIHKLKIKIANYEFIAPVFIADSDNVTPILGRNESLDLFKACFDGEITNIEEK